jgi:hypothetical protein
MDVDLEVEVTADRDRVAGLADFADRLPRPDLLPHVHQGRVRHVGVEVAAILAFAVDQEIVAVEDRVIAGLEDAAVADGDQFGPAGGDDVEALVGATAVARRPEFADRATAAVRPLDREDVGVVGGRPVGAGDAGRCLGGESRRKSEG